MSNPLKTVAAGALLAVGLAFTPAVYAEQNPAGDASDSRMGAGMRPQGMMGMQGGMIGPMSGMMEGCNNMMQGRKSTAQQPVPQAFPTLIEGRAGRSDGDVR